MQYLLHRRWVFAALFGIAILRLILSGAYPLVDPTEGRYAEIPREMMARGDWIVPHLHAGRPFWAKPPLSFWATIASYSVFGLNEFAARAPSFAFAVSTALLVYVLARRLYGPDTALLSVVILATGALFFVMAGAILTDPALLFCVTLALTAFVSAMEMESLAGRRAWGYVFFIALGLGLLAKGPVAWVFILGPIAVWTWRCRLRRAVWERLPWISGTLLALAIGVPWHLAMEWRSPGFLNYYLVGEHLMRFLVPGWTGDLYGEAHKEAPLSIWLYFILGSLPWCLFLGAGLWAFVKDGRNWRELAQDRWVILLLLWMAAPVLLFTPSRNVVVTYVLPSMPPLAVLTALVLRYLAKRPGTDTRRERRVRTAVWAAASFTPLLAFIAVVGFQSLLEDRSQHRLVREFVQRDVDNDAALLYFGGLPYSADFYAVGRAHPIPKSMAFVQYEINDADDDFFAVRKSDLDQFYRADGVAGLERIGDFGRYVLFRELDADELTGEPGRPRELVSGTARGVRSTGHVRSHTASSTSQIPDAPVYRVN